MNRQTGFLAATVLLMVALASLSSKAQNTIFSGRINYGIRIAGDEAVLFPFDNYSIPFRSGLQLEMVEAVRHGPGPVVPLGQPGQPDCNMASYYGTVIRIENEFRMWYLCGGDQDPGRPLSWYRTPKVRVCYTVSKDGVHWDKPNLGLVRYGANTNNNLVDIIPPSGSIYAAPVLYEPEDPDPAKRFKMCYEDYPGGAYCVAYSRDGLVWKNSPNNPVMKNTLEQTGLIKYGSCYYVLGQNRGFNKRVLVVHASYDFEHWTESNVIGFRRDNVGPQRPTIYGGNTGEQVHLGAGLWNRGNVILGIYGQWHGPGPESNDRRHMSMDLGLVVSHDGIHYQEPIPDFKIIPMQNQNWPTPTAGTRLTQGQGFENVGDKTYVWYGLWGPGGGDGVHLAVWERDRLGYLAVPRVVTEGQAPFGAPPHFVSCPIQVDKPEAKIFLNADGLTEISHVRVEILDERFNRIPAYSGSNSVPIKKPGLRQPVTWSHGDRLQKFEHPIRIQVTYEGIRLEDSKIYALYVE